MKVECCECFTIFETRDDIDTELCNQMCCSSTCQEDFDCRLRAANAIVDKIIVNDPHSLRLLHTPQSASAQNLLKLIKATRATQETDLNSESKVKEKKDD
jgi:hypothetical protein